ncbi:MAG TPA: hypothetical protein VFI79_07730 [Gemmatimonadales bacterium]|nr:hypothetical protein [Gemmatimonadales bacterium]
MLTKTMKVGLAAVGGVAVVAAVALGRSRGIHVATIPAGTTLVATLDVAVSTEHARPGDVVRLHTIAPIRLDGGRTTIPSGVVVQATVTESKGGGRIAGAPVLALRFTDVVVDGGRRSIDAEPYRLQGRNDLGKSAAQIGAGTVAGALLGRVVGGKGGTAKGAVVGAAAGTGVAVATPGGQVVLPAGQTVRIHLDGPVTVAYHPRSERSNAD